MDFETRSACDLKKHGARVYAEHPSTRILCVAYSFDRGEPNVWFGDAAPEFGFEQSDPPELLLEYIAQGVPVEIFNADFEPSIWECICVPRFGWPPVQIKQWRDVQAYALHKALPARLEKVAQIVQAPHQKDDEGHRVMLKISKPAPRRKGDAPDLVRWNNDPDLFIKTTDYCRQDVRTEDCLGDALGPLPAPEQALFELDRTINTRGVQIDTDTVRGAGMVLETVRGRIMDEFRGLTSLEITQVQALKEYLEDFGVFTESLDKDFLTATIPNLEPGSEVRRILELRRRFAKASGAKVASMDRWTCRDGRIRNVAQYHGATTGRWAGRGPQFQNLPRPFGEDLFGVEYEDYTEADFDVLCATLARGRAAEVEAMYGDPLVAVSNALRSMIVAAPGHVFIGGDYSGIEMCVTAAVAGEEWKLEAIRKSHRGEGQDMYCVAAEAVFGYPVLGKKTHPKERQVGKVCELAFGYQGAVGAWRNFDKTDHHTDDDVQVYKTAWRGKHKGLAGDPETGDIGLWKGLELAAIECVSTGQVVDYNCVQFEMKGPWLTCRLPSGRRLWYWGPKLRWYPAPWDPEQQIMQLSVEQWRDGRWQRVKMYGGRWTENIVQAISRDLLARAMFLLERAGYPIVLTVHDEALSEIRGVPADALTVFRQCMEDIAPWARALNIPILVEPWTGRRFKK
ncbi:DNA polymerase [uncultured Rhodospira sp.]|uniref:DNA polymerase n=1 Tax=uncultured Rhodospira sp. TaxID=1936189 RepID=UPI0026052198|nr:DNA polymerase [uncultured Rhodospira sp.]